mgnify:CR=1 FL=1
MKNSVLCYLEETVIRFPDKLAISDGSLEVTFSEWRHHALCLAEMIQSRIKGRHRPVLIYLPKSTNTLISFAGVLYSGNFYTPTDIKFPFHKIESILQCLQPELIISDRKSAEKLIQNGISEHQILFWEDIDFSQKIEADKFLNKIIDTDLAYVFFTSGSTGVPKGVAITQRSIVDYIDWASEEFSIDENERIANQAPFYFDNSILDIYLCMSKGATLYIVPEMYYAFQAKLLAFLEEKKITFIFWVPSALVGSANSGLLERFDLSSIHKVLFCGEVMPNRHLNIWRSVLPNAVYANLYGPTEITDVCAFFRVSRPFADDDPLPIGNACRNTEILLLDDENHCIKEPDKMGELCVRGTSLAVGYYDNEEKTREAFVQNPLNSCYEEKIYRTGDLAHYNEFGEIMFDGRKDFQIKHMGYRIELGEIETAILSIEGIDNACCLYDTNNQKIISIYQSDIHIKSLDIKKQLMQMLPKYMVPSEFQLVDQLPYNDNGKIDRRRLKEQFIQ